MESFRRKSHFFDETKILFVLLFFILSISILGQVIAFEGFGLAVQKHIIKIVFGVIIMLLIPLVDLRIWSSFAYPFYLIIFVCLVIVGILGVIKLGAQRWIDLHFFAFQPSEFMKLALIVTLSKYYSELSTFELKSLRYHILPGILIFAPVALILKQPDLGSAMILFAVGVGMIFLVGFPMKAFCFFIGSGVAMCPLGWYFLHDYQKNRILNFLDPDRDPLGTGYHILQSKIAIGSGYMWGQGIFQGDQGRLNFLPEKHTDFIFTTISEELGFVGAAIIISLFILLICYFFWVGSINKNRFAKNLSFGLGLLLFTHMFVNIGMVLGILPVVGIPLPFLSYGGSSMFTFMISCGLIISALAQSKNK